MGSRIFERSPKRGDDRLVEITEMQDELKGIGDLVAKESREPRLIVNFDELHPAHGAFSRTAANCAGMDYSASQASGSLLLVGGWVTVGQEYGC
jgi:hypothetical protein